MRKDLLSKFQGAEAIYSFLVSTAEEIFPRRVERANSVLHREIPCCITGVILRDSPSEETILIVAENNWRRIFGRDESASSAVATYLALDGKIYLRKDRWCLCNFAHETLHSLSAFSVRNGPYRNLKFVYEGLTELLTGWFLKNKFAECFEEWSKIRTCFLWPYLSWVKMWNYFSWKVSIQEVIDIYFDYSAINPLHCLVELMKEKSFNIGNVFANSRESSNLESRFQTELSNAFGSDFDEYMRSNIPVIDPGVVSFIKPNSE